MFEVAESQNLQIVMILAMGFSIASIFGYISQTLRLSPILGYLLAGFIIGPFSPGFVADLHISEQLAEIGVILMMFGVGLHFKLEDLVNVRNIAIPGAVGQTLTAAIMTVLAVVAIGWPIDDGVLIGLAISVASTVVLVRLLSDYNLLTTPQGHVAIGWLIVEDILTVGVLILMPTIAVAFQTSDASFAAFGKELGIVAIKFALLAAIMFTLVSKFVRQALLMIARTRQHELFTLGILALTFSIALGSAIIFGTSIALGAFLAGMIIGQTDVRQQALANSLPMKDAFVVIFFLSVGMLFNPVAIAANFPLFLVVLAIILIVKPISAFLIVIGLKHPVKTAVTVAIALAQIGEFSFILAEEAMNYKIIPDEAFDVIVACALVSIAINPLLFRCINSITNYLGEKTGEAHAHKSINEILPHERQAIVVGFGPIGRAAVNTLEIIGFKAVIIDRNVDTIVRLRKEGQRALFGDAALSNILSSAFIENSEVLIITIPEIEVTLSIIEAARRMNPNIKILARARFLSDQPLLASLDVGYVCCEEESIKAFHEALFQFA